MNVRLKGSASGKFFLQLSSPRTQATDTTLTLLIYEMPPPLTVAHTTGPAVDTRGVPHHDAAHAAVVARPGCTFSQIFFFATLLGPFVGLHSLPGGVRLVTWTTRTGLMGCTHSRGVSDWLQGPYRLSSV
jgi:hypothetical protein